jgi:imidazolonepropionase-like amidohydrolase
VYGLEELHKGLDCGLDELAHMLMGPDAIPESTIARMVDQQMRVVPTLSVRFGPDRKKAIANLRTFKEAGGKVIYGTDLGNAGPTPGIDRREVKAMAAAGMDGLEIIRSATRDAAEWLGLAGKGILRAGFSADVVGVRGDPLGKPLELCDVRFVMRAGNVVGGPR